VRLALGVVSKKRGQDALAAASKMPAVLLSFRCFTVWLPSYYRFAAYICANALKQTPKVSRKILTKNEIFNFVLISFI
jgi:hypothetical protein